MKNNKILLGAFMVLPLLGFSQQARLEYANEMFENLAYFYAAEGYEDVLDRNIDSSIIADKLARSYDEIGNNAKALEWYQYIYRNSELSKEEFSRLALLEREFGNYDASESYMKEFVSKYGETDFSKSVLSPKLSMDALKANNDNFVINNQSINTDASEMGVSFISGSEVLLSSSERKKQASQNIFSGNGDYFYDIYRSTLDSDGNLGKLKRLKGDVDSKFHDGPSAYDSSTGYVYFTRNNYVNRKKGTNSEDVMLLKIYRTKLEDKNFDFIEELNFNSDDYSCAHPSVSADGKKLFFASDMPGGFGGMDIYSIDLTKLKSTSPKNLGKVVNTSLNDVFPHYNESAKLLFFSSEGHAGLGGLDVFAAKFNKDGDIKVIENLGAPVNSMKDDFSFVSNAGQTKGFFTSNRSGGKGSDDIYGFIQKTPIDLVLPKEFIFEGVIADSKTKKVLDNVTVTIFDNLANKAFEQKQTDKAGTFLTAPIEYSTDDLVNYDVKIEKEGYVTKTITVDKTLLEDSDLKIDELIDLVSLDNVEEGVSDLGEILKINPIYFDLNSSIIRADAKVELDKIFKVLQENPGMTIALNSHTDTRADDDYNLWLSDRRAKSSAKYLTSKGISPDRLYSKGFGETELKVSDSEISKVSSEDEKEVLHQKNRRTEFIIMKMK